MSKIHRGIRLSDKVDEKTTQEHAWEYKVKHRIHESEGRKHRNKIEDWREGQTLAAQNKERKRRKRMAEWM